MLSGTDVACVAIDVAMCLINGSPLDQRVVQTKTTIHTRKSHERGNIE